MGEFRIDGPGVYLRRDGEEVDLVKDGNDWSANGGWQLYNDKGQRFMDNTPHFSDIIAKKEPAGVVPTVGYWRTRGGEKVRVLCVDSSDEKFPVIADLGNGSCEIYTAEGRVATYGTDALDLVSPWIDPVVVDRKALIGMIQEARGIAGLGGFDRDGMREFLDDCLRQIAEADNA